MLETVQGWQDELLALHERIVHRFHRAEPRRRALGYLQGLLATCERKNGWHLAELLGEATPDGVQRLLNAATWDADAVRDDLRAYVTEQFGSSEAVLVLDETGFLKKGTHSVGVQRQYSGTAGRVENCQIGVFLYYATPERGAFLDRALYLPESWAQDLERCRQAGVPLEEVSADQDAEDQTAEEGPALQADFKTKPELARDMLARVFEAGVPSAWVTADTVYGGDRRLRTFLEEHGQPFVLAVPKNERLWWGGPVYYAASDLAEQVPEDAWQRLSAGDGAKGPRLYDWALLELWRLQVTEEERQWGHYLLVRRSVDDPEELAYYVVFARRTEATLERLARIAGMRWQIESAFEEAKGECGLDEYEVRTWQAWHRHITLSLLAHAFLSVLRAQERKKGVLSAAMTAHPTSSA